MNLGRISLRLEIKLTKRIVVDQMSIIGTTYAHRILRTTKLRIRSFQEAINDSSRPKNGKCGRLNLLAKIQADFIDMAIIYYTDSYYSLLGSVLNQLIQSEVWH